MRSTRGFTLLSAALVGLLFPPLAWGQPAALPGPGPIAPASDVLHVSPVSPETLEPPPPRGYAEDMVKAKRDAASVRGVAPGVVDLDRGATYGPGWLPPGVQPGASQDGGGGPLPSAPSLTTNFNGIDYTFSFPPDPVMAAGPTNLVLVVNGSVTIRNKTGGLVASTSLATFFSSVRVSGENAFDPRVVYDTGSSRFFLLAVGRISNSSCTPGTCVSHFFLGVSKNSSPATTGSADWFFYAFDATLDGATATTNWADYPDLGVDPTAVVLTANMFSFSSGSFQRAKIRILDKSVLIAGGAAGFTDFVGMTDPSTGFLSFTLRAALTFGSPGTFFLVSASRTSGSCDIVVWGIANPLSSPTLTSRLATAGGTCNSPPDASQLGGGGFPLLDTGDKRLYNAVYRNSSLWTAQSISMNFGSGAVSAIRWVQVNVSSWPASVSFTQDSTFGADGIWYFYPAVMVDASNNMGVVLARSSASEFASAYYTGRLSTDTVNTLQPTALLKAGAAAQNLVDSIGRNRYGDYLGIGLDPADGSFWILGEYVVSTSSWGTWVGNFSLAPPLTLQSLTANPPSPQPQNTTIVFTATGAGGNAPYQYKWWLSTDGGATWFVVQDWGAGNTFTWGPSTASATTLIGVWLRSAGNTNDMFEGGGSIPFVVTGVASLASLTANPPSPQPVFTTITFTATGSGGTPPYQYKWWLSTNGGATWFVVRDWGTGNTFTWGPSTASATTLIGVWLRSAGNTNDMFEGGGSIPFVVTGVASLASLTANPPSPQPVFTTITFTATGSGGTPPYQFKWWLSTNAGQTWIVVRDWGAGNTFTWGPTTANSNYMIGVWLRSAGNTNDMFEGGGAIPFVITP